ncbi:hypothetical protein J8F10_26045 [Gemmata sp. G18]|uniref:Carboxypeptidase regulatory-like domain-containing protein n=1 Tax=Gemmata palustris TaxID=2822762 RepID=A0ABS5BZ69_9BACT|nr:hypothetical protein [Gemmata palustris]MBP3958722.1 hypothetical protein [Gemmata palustris]
MTLRTATLLVAMLMLSAGCGGKPAKQMITVTGTVNYQGHQLNAGIIKFLAPNGDFATAAIRPDGTFLMTDVVPGEQKVAYVSGPVSVGSSDKAPSGNAPKAKAATVPAKFSDPQTSGVTVSVPESGGAVTVELK